MNQPKMLPDARRAPRAPAICAVVTVAVVVLAALFRLTDLNARSMHCDEAVQAVKFGQLLEDGDYRYDPHEYHGPSLNYLTLLPVHLARKSSLDEVCEVDLRRMMAYHEE